MKPVTVALALVSAGFICAQPAPQTAAAPSSGEALLRASMDMYHSLKSLSVESKMVVNSDAKASPVMIPPITKKFDYSAPNLYLMKLTAQGLGDLKVVSDGKKLVMLILGAQGQAMTDKAPENMWKGGGALVDNPIYSSVLFKMLGGSETFGDLVDTAKGSVTQGSEVTMPDGQKAIHVNFESKGSLPGRLDLVIGEENKEIYSATDSIALPTSEGTALRIAESFSDFQPNPAINPSEFDTAIPKGVQVSDMSAPAAGAGEDGEKPPVPLGKPAPDFKVYSLDNGRPMKLSSLKGKVVVIDFWATWCPPCRESLPHTQDIYKNYRAKNVVVVTISDEEAGVIRDFIKQNKYTFPVYRDPSSSSDKAYGITGIPTVVVIDAQGNLSSFMVGLRDESEIVNALKKAGVN